MTCTDRQFRPKFQQEDEKGPEHEVEPSQHSYVAPERPQASRQKLYYKIGGVGLLLWGIALLPEAGRLRPKNMWF